MSQDYFCYIVRIGRLQGQIGSCLRSLKCKRKLTIFKLSLIQAVMNWSEQISKPENERVDMAMVRMDPRRD